MLILSSTNTCLVKQVKSLTTYKTTKLGSRPSLASAGPQISLADLCSSAGNSNSESGRATLHEKKCHLAALENIIMNTYTKVSGRCITTKC